MTTITDSPSITAQLDNMGATLGHIQSGMTELDGRLSLLASAVAAIATDLDEVKALVATLADRLAARR